MRELQLGKGIYMGAWPHKLREPRQCGREEPCDRRSPSSATGATPESHACAQQNPSGKQTRREGPAQPSRRALSPASRGHLPTVFTEF